jgi:hypothetical protein
MWITTRASRGSPWASPRNLGPSINTIYSDWIGAISPDGWCYLDDFLGPRPGGLGQEDIWQASITPLVDFNGDGKIDAADTAVLADNWGTSNCLCDIGPFPLGDGVEPTTMWLSTGAGPNWIPYECDKVYQRHEMQAWNSNQLIESFMGLGAKGGRGWETRQ